MRSELLHCSSLSSRLLALPAHPLNHPPAPPPAPPCRRWAPEVSDEGLEHALAPLTRLQSLHLGGHLMLGEAACGAAGRRLRRLTSLQLTDCAGVDDGAAFRLAPLAPSLLRLGFSGCPRVTDIALAALLRSAPRLAHLELAGCQNITGLGLRALGDLRHLASLNLAGCDAITGASEGEWSRSRTRVGRR